MIRVLHVVTVMNRGGIESMLMNLYRNIDRTEIQFDFLVHRQEKGAFDNEINKLGGNMYYVPSINPFHHKKYLKLLDSFFAEHHYRIVHSHINTFSMYILRAAKKANIPCRIAHAHTDRIGLDYKFFIKLYCKKKLNKYAVFRFACSKKAGEWLFENNMFSIINNAIDLLKFKFDSNTRNLYRKQLGIENNFVLGHIGNFSGPKNYPFLIDIFAEIAKKESNAKLLLIGDGLLKKNIENKVNQLNLCEKVIFLGIRKDIAELLSCLDVFIFPSLFEGIPVTLIETQASGINIIASDSISERVKVTPLANFLSLKKSASDWANEILKYGQPYERKFYLSELQVAGYDVKETAKWLSEFYKKSNNIDQ